MCSWCFCLIISFASAGPKFDQPSYPGFERDVFKSVSDYFHTLPEPMLTFQYYELFVNVLGMCGFDKFWIRLVNLVPFVTDDFIQFA